MSRAFDYCKAVYEKSNIPENRMFSYDDKSIEIDNTCNIIKSFFNSDKDFPFYLTLEEVPENKDSCRMKDIMVSFNNNADFNITISSMAGYYDENDINEIHNVLISSCFRYIFEQLPLPEEYNNDEYKNNFWNYNMEYEFGNVIICNNDEKFKTKVINKDGAEEEMEYDHSCLVTVPFMVKLNKK